MKMTQHARQRAAERQGADRAEARKNAEKAMRNGQKRTETTGGLRRFLDATYKRHRTANNIKVYNGFVYLFRNGTLITLFPIPERYREEAGKKATGGVWTSCAECVYIRESADGIIECGKRLRDVDLESGCWIGERRTEE